MNLKSGIKALTVLSALAVWGCMSMGQDDSKASLSNQDALKFVRSSAPVLGKSAAQGDEYYEEEDDISADELALINSQCPKLGNLISDLMNADEDSEELPQSFTDFLSCFDITLTELENAPEEAFGKLDSAFTNMQSLLTCICGEGSPAALNWQTFTAANANAGGTAFNSANANAGGSAFNSANANAGGGGFNAAGAGAGGTRFTAE